MRSDNPRWVEVTPSRFSHERAGLAHVKALFPDAEPYRAWSNLEIITDRGRSLEIDLLVLAPGGLYLIELKAWSGRIGGDRYRWRITDDRVVTKDNPWRLANDKAKVLKGLLVNEVKRHARELGKRIDTKGIVPYVKAAVFLHGPDVRCELAEEDRTQLYGLEGQGDSTHLPGIIQGLVTSQPPNPDRAVTADQGDVLAMLMDRIGMTRRSKRVVGPYELDESVHAEGAEWQDFLATHHRFSDERRRVRIYHTGSATSREQRAMLVRAAEREYLLLRHLTHPSLLGPQDFYDTDNGPALVYPYDSRFERLDHLLAARSDELSLETRLRIVRGLAETLRYAHGRHVTHRGLSPRSVSVRTHTSERPELRVSDWHTAARSASSASSSPSGTGTPDSLLSGTRHLDALVEDESLVFLAPEAGVRADVEQADRVKADVFSLGAVAYTVLTGAQPAPDPARLRVRLYEQGGLDIASRLDGVPESLRELTLDATRGAVGSRLPDTQAFLCKLDEIEEELAEPEPPERVDPLDATPGTLLDDRWTLVRRLGSGATAVGLFVEEGDGARRVLKVARDEERAKRLRDEAEVLRGLDVPGVAGLVDGSITVGDRPALLLEYAGPQTLATVLHQEKLSLDRLERYGRDLLSIATALASRGIDHRDIKPDNLGIRERPADRQKHLVLFDFSLARTPATETEAGTPPYLDPFLGPPRRPRWDPAAERYAIAVTLFEMAVGHPPEFGDPRTNPAVVEDEATVEEDMFDPAVAGSLTEFFRTSLRRDATERFDTVDDMLAAWDDAFRRVGEAADDPGALAEQATPGTPLREAGLSARALSAVEPLDVRTAGELAEIPAAELTRLGGANVATRREISARAKQWRNRFAPDQRTDTGRPAVGGPDGELPSPRSVDAVLDALLPRATSRNETEVEAARLLLGRPSDAVLSAPSAPSPSAPSPSAPSAPGASGEAGAESPYESPPDVPWASQSRRAALLGMSQPRVAQLDATLFRRWARRAPALREVRDELVAFVESQSGVVTAEEAARLMIATRGSVAAEPARLAGALGLIRAAVEAEMQSGGNARLDWGRRGGTVLIARESREPRSQEPAAAALVEYAGELGARAAELVQAGDALVTPHRALRRLRQVTIPEAGAELGDARLLRLATAASGTLALSSGDELYRRGLAAAAALRHSGEATVAVRGAVTPAQLRDRVRSRFPEAQPLPDPPELTELLREQGSPLEWDAGLGGYSTRPAGDSSDYAPRRPTSVATTGDGAEFDPRLRESIAARGYMVLGCSARRLDETARALVSRYDLTGVNVTDVLLARMRELAEAGGIPWDTVLAADAAQRQSTDGQGLRNLVAEAVGGVRETVEAAGGPVLLTEIGPLLRYGHVDLLERLADQTTRRAAAVWVLIPAARGDDHPTLDGQPVPVITKAQWLRLPESWQPARVAGGA